jgi:hypothetical protein
VTMAEMSSAMAMSMAFKIYCSMAVPVVFVGCPHNAASGSRFDVLSTSMHPDL